MAHGRVSRMCLRIGRFWPIRSIAGRFGYYPTLPVGPSRSLFERVWVLLRYRYYYDPEREA